MYSKKVAYIPKTCVGCGSCVKACQREAVAIYKGMYADIDDTKCVGCGKCAKVCPAGIIIIAEREAKNEN